MAGRLITHGIAKLMREDLKGIRCPIRQNFAANSSAKGEVYSWGRAGIAADIRYAFGTPLSYSKRRPLPDAMPQRQHTR